MEDFLLITDATITKAIYRSMIKIRIIYNILIFQSTLLIIFCDKENILRNDFMFGVRRSPKQIDKAISRMIRE